MGTQKKRSGDLKYLQDSFSNQSGRLVSIVPYGRGSNSKESREMCLSATPTVMSSGTMSQCHRTYSTKVRASSVLRKSFFNGGEQSVDDCITGKVNEMTNAEQLDLTLEINRRLKCEAWVDSLEFINQDSEELRRENFAGAMKSYDYENIGVSVSEAGDYGSQSQDTREAEKGQGDGNTFYTCRLCQDETCVTREQMEQHMIDNHRTEWLKTTRPDTARSPENGREKKCSESTVHRPPDQHPSSYRDSCLGLKVGQMQKVSVVNVESPTAVYLCPNMEQLSKFQKHIYRLGASLPHNPDFIPSPGSIVLVKSLQDGYWYRGLVERRVEEDQVEFFCPDFGFKEMVDLAKVRQINERLQQSFFTCQKFLACRCVLSDWRDSSGPTSERELRNLKKLLPVSDRGIRVSVREETELGYVVDIPGVTRDMAAGKDKVEREQEELVKLRMEVEKYKESIQKSLQGLRHHL